MAAIREAFPRAANPAWAAAIAASVEVARVVEAAGATAEVAATDRHSSP